VKDKMRAARLHQPGQPLQIDSVPVPRIRSHEVLVRVESCGVISNMNAVFSGQYWYHLPPLPAIVGLDAAGVIEEVGSEVNDFRQGERVYINPLLSCGSCHHCRSGHPVACAYSAFRGYFAFSAQAVKLLAENPHGGFAEYTAASARNLVKLPPEVSFELGARWGYLGTSFAAIEAGGARSGSWVLVNGVTGILGVGAVLWALGMGVSRILGLGRSAAIMQRLEALAPRRIRTLALGSRPIGEWARECTDGVGADMLLDCTGRGSLPATTLDALAGLRPGGIAINVSALTDPLPINPVKFMTAQLQYRGSNWFSVEQGQRMAEMARCGVADLGRIEPRVYPLEKVNEALAEVKQRPGGFVNIVVAPGR
jgi:D-arabinose 1-dehydrogenase-like Zn-dependent alcohol dehydrogenase